MQYQWNKILAPEETLQKEFGLSTKYRNATIALIIIAGIAVCFFSLFAGGFIFFLGGIYWLYLTRAKHYAFTTKRMILVDAFVGSRVVSIDYNQITDIEIEQSVFDELGGWGTIVINTAGTYAPEIRLSFIDNPQNIKQSLDQIRDSNK